MGAGPGLYHWGFDKGSGAVGTRLGVHGLVGVEYNSIAGKRFVVGYEAQLHAVRGPTSAHVASYELFVLQASMGVNTGSDGVAGRDVARGITRLVQRARTYAWIRACPVLHIGPMMRRHGGQNVADPAQQSAGADPHSRRDNQPEDAAQEVAVVELADARNHGAQDRRRTWIPHRAIVPPDVPEPPHLKATSSCVNSALGSGGPQDCAVPPPLPIVACRNPRVACACRRPQRARRLDRAADDARGARAAGLRRPARRGRRRARRRQQDDHLSALADARRAGRRGARQLATPPIAVETGRLECDLHATFMTATTLRSTPAGRGVVRALIAERGDPEVDRVVQRAARAAPRAGPQRARAGAAPRRPAEARRHRAAARRSHRHHLRPAARMSRARSIRSGCGASCGWCYRARPPAAHSKRDSLMTTTHRDLLLAAAVLAGGRRLPRPRTPPRRRRRRRRRAVAFVTVAPEQVADHRRVDRHARRHRQRADPAAGLRLPDAPRVPRRRVRPQGRACCSRSIAGRSRPRSARRKARLAESAGAARQGRARSRARSAARRAARDRAESARQRHERARRGAGRASPRRRRRSRAPQLNLGFTRVTSLIDGVAAIASAQIGDLVGPTTLLTTVSQVDPIKAYFPISEQEYLAHRRARSALRRRPRSCGRTAAG